MVLGIALPPHVGILSVGLDTATREKWGTTLVEVDGVECIVFLDVAPLGGDVLRTSAAEACAVRDLCAALVAAGVPPHALGVIAPYRAQVALIRNLLRRAGCGDLVVDTVDRFQGSARAAMLLSLVGGAGQVGRLLQDERRLNVALTRARHKLVLLGNARELRADPLYGRLLDAVGPPAPGDVMATGPER